jgi:hypothetical protein
MSRCKDWILWPTPYTYIQTLCFEDIRGNGGIAPPFFTLALEGGEWSASRPTSGERAPGTHWIGDWVDSIAGVDVVGRENSCQSWDSKHGRPAVDRRYTDFRRVGVNTLTFLSCSACFAKIHFQLQSWPLFIYWLVIRTRIFKETRKLLNEDSGESRLRFESRTFWLRIWSDARRRWIQFTPFYPTSSRPWIFFPKVVSFHQTFMLKLYISLLMHATCPVNRILLDSLMKCST